MLFSAAPPAPAAAKAPRPSASEPPFAPSPDKVIVYSGCTLIDGTRRTRAANMAIMTRGEQIETIVPRRNWRRRQERK